MYRSKFYNMNIGVECYGPYMILCRPIRDIHVVIMYMYSNSEALALELLLNLEKIVTGTH